MKNIITLFFGALSLQFFGQAHVSSSLEYFQSNPGFANTTETNRLKDVSEAQVNYSTGTAILDLPIYPINAGNINLPVSLNYATSGIKVDDEASWVGLGWVLNAGAIISRQIKGLPDEAYYIYPSSASVMSNQVWIQTWINDCQNIMTMPMTVPSSLPQSSTYGNFFYFFSKSAEKMAPCGSSLGPSRDIQPDLYSVNLNGKKIEFVFDITQTPRILNDNGAFKILHDRYNFTILDEFGTKYFFKSTDAEKLITNVKGSTHYNSTTANLTYYDLGFMGYSNSYNLTGCTSDQLYGLHRIPRIKWNLSKVESPDGKYSIDLEYDDYAHYEYNTNFIYTIDKTTKLQHFYIYDDVADAQRRSLATEHGINVQTSFNCYYGKRLKKIIWQDGYMTFETGVLRDDVHPYTSGSTLYPVNDNRSLSAIKIFNTSNTELHRFAFNYSYFNSSISTIDGFSYRSKRLKLLSLTEYSSNLTAKPPYLFEYDNTNLPVRFSFEKDFWGYYKANGATHMQGTNYFYPSYSNTNLSDFTLWSQSCIYPISLTGSGTPVTVTGVNRLPNLANTQACVLKKITYPLKGNQQFDYELNTFCIDNDLVNRDAGGLRIKKITTSDGFNASKDIVKNFYYDYETVNLPNATKRSSGEINFLPVFGREAIDVYYTIVFPNFYKVHSDNFASSVNSSNSQVFYREVKVEEPGKGSTIYKFDNAGTFGHNKDVSSGTVFLIEKDKTDIVTSGAPSATYPDRNDVMLKRANFPYAPEPNTDWANGTIREIQYRDQINNTVSKKTFNYTIKSHTKIKSFDLSNFLMSITQPLQNPGAFTVRSLAIAPYYYLSVWRVLDTETEYVYDPSFPNNIAKAQVKTINYNFSSNTHKFLTSKSTTQSDGKIITEKYKYVADFNISNPTGFSADVPSIALLNMRYKTNQLKNTVEAITTQNIGSNMEILNGYYSSYKDLANSSAQGLNNPVVRNFESYAFENPTPLPYSFFNPAIFAQTGINLTTTFDSRFKRKMTNQFFDSKGNLIQSKIENGTESSFIYGYNKTIPIAEVLNAKYSEIAHTSFESEEVSSWIHTPSNILTVDKKTGEKCYSIAPAPTPGGVGYDLILDKAALNINQTGKYVFSCWVKTPSGFNNNSARITAVSNNGINLSTIYPSNQASAYKTAFIQNTNNKWVYYSVTIDLMQIRIAASLPPPPYGPHLGLRFFIDTYNTSQGFLVDDVRITPANAFMNTMTAKPLIGVTSQTDSRNTTESYEFDTFGRPVLTRDLNNNILEKTIYNYK
jgi:hypothetical protein